MTQPQEFDEADDFGEDEFAEDDFADDSSYVADDVPFSLGAPGFEALSEILEIWGMPCRMTSEPFDSLDIT